MSEQAKREPKDYEVWYVMLSDGSIKPAVAWIPPNPENTVWYIDGDSCCADPIAPVPSHELVAELVDALKDAQGGLDYIRSFHGELYGVGFDRCETQTLAVLAKAKLAGLGGK